MMLPATRRGRAGHLGGPDLAGPGGVVDGVYAADPGYADHPGDYRAQMPEATLPGSRGAVGILFRFQGTGTLLSPLERCWYGRRICIFLMEPWTPATPYASAGGWGYGGAARADRVRRYL